MVGAFTFYKSMPRTLPARGLRSPLIRCTALPIPRLFVNISSSNTHAKQCYKQSFKPRIVGRSDRTLDLQEVDRDMCIVIVLTLLQVHVMDYPDA